ncbi:MAG: aminotransferase class V-fold PLP-dependent enzyme [Saprospiraceae bacterium]|uniref:Aminotransferase class V-fold PLP-dependent enzyme n=1 Tax=Candidatus Opimibacter skivensis TaxID=2982028 RepID=A0A9D7SXX5_9BACT|nr:aminotransferase class V-fold PLP-dependent enzyme [Candidatus Opimibacter skivensis]
MKSFQRRTFLGQIAAAGAAPLLSSFLLPGADLGWIDSYKKSNVSLPLSQDEKFWYQIKTMYSTSPGLLNLNNGGVSPQPLIVQEARERYDKMCNEAPSYYMWRVLDQGREPLRQRLADLAGVSNEEISICRNASEALETIIFGLRLQKGDAVVLSRLDYPNMMNAWKQREMRDGIILKWVELDLPKMTEDEVVDAFEAQMTPDVKIVHITHMINWNGHILPVRKIADKAHAKSAKVLVDGAHTFAHITFKIPELGADFFGTSLHKWLCAPFGSGMMYVKKDHIADLYPLFGTDKPESADIRKFESLGTRSFPIEQAIGQAIDFHYTIGSELKEERLQYLKKYWTDGVKDHPKIKIKTDTHPTKSCALCIVAIDGMTGGELTGALHEKFKIHTTSIDYYNVQGVRVTPHIYIVKSDLDRLISALHTLADT